MPPTLVTVLSPTRSIAYLWRCAGFGADPVQFQRGLHLGYQRSLSELLEGQSESDDDAPLTTLAPPGIALTVAQLAGLVTWWLNRMATTASPLREKMTFFWHSYFTTSADPVFSAGLLLRQNRLLRSHALDRFEDLLIAIAKDPAMLIYLDGFRNADGDGKPNENFAREVMELFSLGAEHYQEQDVKEAARAFSGWGLQWWGPRFRFYPECHDSGPKRFLGEVGAWQGEDVLRKLARHPATARQVCQRLFLYLTGCLPDEAALHRWSKLFLRCHGHMRVVLQEMLLSPEFLASNPSSGYLSPVEYVVQLLRALDVRIPQVSGWRLLERLQKMGQMPFLPPSVRGWPHGDMWLNTATLRERLATVEQIFEIESPRRSWIEQQVGTSALWSLAQRPDAGAAARRALERHHRNPWQLYGLILKGPELHRR